MKLKIFPFALISLVCQFSTAASYTFQPRYTNSFRFAATDVWNMDFQFQASSSINVYFTASIGNNGKSIATLKSNSILISPGLQSFNSATINTLQLNWNSQAIADIETLTGSFPSGEYQVCYNAYCVTADCDGLGDNALFNESPQCFDLTVEPPTPLLLAFPEDKSELEWPRPTFNWIPPMPLGQVHGFTYNFTLVQSNKNQTCADAIVRNRPIYQQSGIEIPTLPYPAEIDDLDTAKTYCWKVDGIVEGIAVAQSEVWEFRLKVPDPDKHGISMIQTDFEMDLNCNRVKYIDTLSIKFIEEYANHIEGKLQIMFWDESNHKEQESIIIEQVIALGKQIINIIPWETPGLAINKIYIINIQNAKGEINRTRVQFID